MGVQALVWCGLGLGVVLPPLLVLRGVGLPYAILAGALSPVALGVAFLASLYGSWGAVRYPGSEDSRSVALAIASIVSAGTWAAGTALALVVAGVRERRRARLRGRG